MRDVLFIEPYYGGSHRAFADGWREHSRHRVRLLTMPARKWKWRMRGAALYVADRLPPEPPDAIVASDYLDLAALRGLRPDWTAHVPCVAYFHENQLTYPLPDEDERDYQFGFTNVTTCLAAGRALFNSRYHMESFAEAAEALLRRMPDCVPEGIGERIRRRAEVVPVGVNLAAIDALRPETPHRTGPIRILWNHRWEFDKNPDEFFAVMEQLDEEGLDFELAVVGETFRTAPPAFERARRRLAHRLTAFGYVESREQYLRRLLESDVVVSTAIHEFFGIAVVEAIRAGCAPLLPDRLSYPEILPSELHQAHLYRTPRELRERLRDWARRPERARAAAVPDAVARFGWQEVAPRLDDVVEAMCGAGPGA